jgi:hypothetical protein
MAVSLEAPMKKKESVLRKFEAPLITPTDLGHEAVKDIAGVMNAILADVFALYLKTKNFHWHVSGPRFRAKAAKAAKAAMSRPGSPLARSWNKSGST